MKRILILNCYSEAKRIYGNLINSEKYLFKFVWEELANPKEIFEVEKFDLILLSLEWNADQRIIVSEAKKRGIPSLYVMDGVIEWNYIWKNHSFVFPEGTVLQPLISDYISTIGINPSRILSGLGLGKKINIVGLPRLSNVKKKTFGKRKIGNHKILICTANTSAHNLAQKINLKKALKDLKNKLVNELHIECIWRISEDLANDIGVKKSSKINILDDLNEVDAVISSPSTVIIESMICGIPTAIIDYGIDPIYISSAWQIRGENQIESTVHDLLYPSIEKMMYQDYCLSQEIELGDSTQRLEKLVDNIINKKLIDENIKIHNDSEYGLLDFKQVHSHLSSFSINDKVLLQYEVEAYSSKLKKISSYLREILENIESNFMYKFILSRLPGFKQFRRLLKLLKLYINTL